MLLYGIEQCCPVFDLIIRMRLYKPVSDKLNYDL
jgi:hypothetical protein